VAEEDRRDSYPAVRKAGNKGTREQGNEEDLGGDFAVSIHAAKNAA
jgi:hypothetical protein